MKENREPPMPLEFGPKTQEAHMTFKDKGCDIKVNEVAEDRVEDHFKTTRDV